MSWHKRSTLIVVASLMVLVTLGIALLALNLLSDRAGTSGDIRTIPDTSSSGSIQEEPSELWSQTLEESELGSIVRILSPFKRRLALDDLLTDPTNALLMEFLEQTETIHPKRLRDEFQEAIIRKLAIVDPWEALSVTDDDVGDGQGYLISAIFEEWSASNPIRAIEHLREMEESLRDYALQGILHSGIKLPDEIQRDLARLFDITQFALDQKAASILDQSIDDPQESWHSLRAVFGTDRLPTSEVQRDALIYVAQEWLKRDRFNATEAILDSFPQREDRIPLVEEILKGLFDSDYDELGDFAADIERVDRVVLSQAIAGWATIDGSKALNAARLIDREDAIDPNRMQRTAIDSWAENHPHSLIAALPQVPEDLRLWSQQTALIAMGKTTPEAIPALLKDVKDKRVREMVVINSIDDWAKVDPYAAYEWAIDPEIRKLPGSSEHTVFEVIARENPHAALSIARTFPKKAGGIGREADVISAMADLDVDVAISMLASARNKATRRSAYGGIGMALILQGDSDRAIELVKDEPDAVQARYFDNFIYMWAEYEPRDMLNKLDVLPTNEVREMCTSFLLKINEDDPFLTVKDMEKLEQYVEENEQHLLQFTED